MMYKYEHGGDIYTEKLTKDGRPFVDYSANINPLGLPLGIKQAVQQALKLCINYPDPFCRELAEVTASYLQLPHEYIFFGNGAADVLFRLALALKPGRALLLAPTVPSEPRPQNLQALVPSVVVSTSSPTGKDLKVTSSSMPIVNPSLGWSAFRLS